MPFNPDLFCPALTLLSPTLSYAVLLFLILFYSIPFCPPQLKKTEDGEEDGYARAEEGKTVPVESNLQVWGHISSRIAFQLLKRNLSSSPNYGPS